MSANSNGDPRKLFFSAMVLPLVGGAIIASGLMMGLMRLGAQDSGVFRYLMSDRAAWVVADQWSASARADSLAARVTKISSNDTALTVMIDSGVSAPIAAVVDSALREQWKAIGPKNGSVRVAAFVVLDTVTAIAQLKLPRWRQPYFILPDRLDGKTCVSVVRISRSIVLSPALLQESTMSMLPRVATLGTCAFYAALGSPGAGAKTWLEESGVSRAVRAGWWRPERPIAVRERVATDSSISNFNAYSDRIIEAFNSPVVSNCRRGNTAACASVVQGNAAIAQSQSFLRVSIPGYDRVKGIFAATEWSVESDSYGMMLSDLIRRHGVDRVGAAWRGDAPFMSAIAAGAASGSVTSVADVGADWVATRAPRVVGNVNAANPATIAAVFGAVLAALALGMVTAQLKERG